MAAVDETFHLHRRHWQEMRAEVERCLPEEGSGFVAGLNGVSLAVYPVENALHSLVRYRMEPHQQLQAMLAIEAQGWELAAIYHSHPNGPQAPSPTDVAEAAYPDTRHIIWYRQLGEWQCRGFWIEDGVVREARLEIVEVE